MSFFKKIAVLVFIEVACFANFALANHVVVNCGSPGFWDNSVVKTPSDKAIYVSLMNDGQVQVQWPNENWVQLGVTSVPGNLSLASLNISVLQVGHQFKNPHFQMVLTQEFNRPRQPKNRRFFRTEFNSYRAKKIPLECAFGLK